MEGGFSVRKGFLRCVVCDVCIWIEWNGDQYTKAEKTIPFSRAKPVKLG